MMTQCSRIGLLALVVAGAGFGAAGCMQSVDQDPKFVQQVKRLDTATSDLKDIGRRLAAFDSEFQQVSKDVAAMRVGGPGTGGDAYKALEARIIRIENSIKTLNDTMMAVKNTAPAEKAKPQPAAEPSESPAEEEGEALAAKTEKLSSPEKSEKTVGSISARKTSRRAVAAEPAAEAPRRAGRYIKIGQGESLAQIAQRHGVSTEALLTANRLPSGAKISAGQQIYVPGR